MKMKNIRFLVLSALSLLVAMVTVILSFSHVGKVPVLVREPEEARQTVKAMLDSVNTGDLETVSRYMLGHPDFGPSRQAETAAGQILWDGFLSSFTYEIPGECYTDDQGICLDIQVSYLDFSSVVDGLGERVEEMLTRKIRTTDNLNEIYDENQEYREELIQALMARAAQENLRNGETVTSQLTVHLSYTGNQWWVVPDSDLLKAISGGTAA